MRSDIRIVIADDHAIFRHGLKLTIETNPDYKVIAEASDGEAALHLTAEQQPDVLVSDASMPKMNGFRLAEELKRRRLPTLLVFLTMLHTRTTAKYQLKISVTGEAPELSSDRGAPPNCF